MKLFDLHCDTLLCAYAKGSGLHRSGLHIDLDLTASWDAYGQVLAVFSSEEKSPAACFEQFDRVMDYYETIRPLDSNFTPVFGVEGGKLLEGDLSRVDHLRARGVRVLTLVWGEVSCMGGAFHTDIGLTDFGKQVVQRCFALGILPDVSHASLPMTEQTISMGESAGKTVIASHSCFRALNPHPRNLTDDHALRIARLGGLIGVNLVREHLTDKPDACSIETVIDHIRYGINLCGTDAICLGCDLDGTAPLPDGISHVGDLPILHARLADRLHSEDLADAVFYENVRRTFDRTIFAVSPVTNPVGGIKL